MEQMCKFEKLKDGDLFIIKNRYAMKMSSWTHYNAMWIDTTQPWICPLDLRVLAISFQQK